jgi:hypothetical protein
VTNLRQASAEHFQQRAELLPLRNRGLRAQLPSMTRNVVDMIGSKFNFALGGMRLYQRNLVNGSVSLPVEMWALSPSQYENLIAKQNLGALIVSQTRPEARIPDRNPNHGSVASVVMVGNCHILLGADLEEPGDTRLGWSAVRSNPGRPNLHCSIFKIPHHGSITAHDDTTWQQLVVPAPYAAVSRVRTEEFTVVGADRRPLRFFTIFCPRSTITSEL